jgi:uncharacterized protein
MPTIDQARAWYANADPIHDFEHILRVLALAERLANAEGADLEIVRAAVLLHDAADAAPDNEAGRLTHHEDAASFAKKILREEGWGEDRIEAALHCIRAHRFRGGEVPRTLEAMIMFDADKLDVLGAIGVARTFGYAAIAGQPLTGKPSQKFLATLEKEPDEPHTAYHEYLFKLSRLKDRFHTQTAKMIAEERSRYLDEFFERLHKEERGEL